MLVQPVPDPRHDLYSARARYDRIRKLASPQQDVAQIVTRMKLAEKIEIRQSISASPAATREFIPREPIASSVHVRRYFPALAGEQRKSYISGRFVDTWHRLCPLADGDQRRQVGASGSPPPPSPRA